MKATDVAAVVLVPTAATVRHLKVIAECRLDVQGGLTRHIPPGGLGAGLEIAAGQVETSNVQVKGQKQRPWLHAGARQAKLVPDHVPAAENHEWRLQQGHQTQQWRVQRNLQRQTVRPRCQRQS
mmetsp:Transcript_5366/g.10113  ORF Transcript_5366/g.10113 Transcript_5366/m.10113 type:complete len:124 (-) Transcript_5366:589-960(-)